MLTGCNKFRREAFSKEVVSVETGTEAELKKLVNMRAVDQFDTPQNPKNIPYSSGGPLSLPSHEDPAFGPVGPKTTWPTCEKGGSCVGCTYGICWLASGKLRGNVGRQFEPTPSHPGASCAMILLIAATLA